MYIALLYLYYEITIVHLLILLNFIHVCLRLDSHSEASSLHDLNFYLLQIINYEICV